MPQRKTPSAIHQKGSTASTVSSLPSPTQQSHPHYPNWSTFLRHIAVHFLRGPLYAAFITVFVVRPILFPVLVQWFSTVDLSFVPSAIENSFRVVNRDGAYTTQEKPNTNSVGSVFRDHSSSFRDAMFFVWMTAMIHAAMYIVVNGFFLLADHYHWLARYKLPRTTRMLPSRQLITETLVEAVFSQIVGVLILVVVAHFTAFPSFFGGNQGAVPNGKFAAGSPSIAMTLQMTALHFFFCQLWNEVAFYVVHRALHASPALYRHIHKKHHSYVGSVGPAAEHAHPVEAVLAGQIPTAGYVVLFSRSLGLEFTAVWFLWRLFETYESHSGYCFEGCFLHKLGLLNTHQAKFHDWHHTDNRGNFGFYWLDYLLGTMDSFAEHERRKCSPQYSQ